MKYFLYEQEFQEAARNCVFFYIETLQFGSLFYKQQRKKTKEVKVEKQDKRTFQVLNINSTQRALSMLRILYHRIHCRIRERERERG